MELKKCTISDFIILEKLPPKVDLRMLIDHFAHYKQPRKKVFDLARKGLLEFVGRGNYLNLKTQNFKETPLENIAAALYFPSYISAEWALQYYGLLTDRVHTVTSVTSRKSAYFKTSLGNFEFKHLHKHRYAFGYEVHPTFGFMIARPEKALLDALKLRDFDMKLNSSDEMDHFLNDYLRIDLSAFLKLTTINHLRELIAQYHRNAKEARILKWLLIKKGSGND